MTALLPQRQVEISADQATRECLITYIEAGREVEVLGCGGTRRASKTWGAAWGTTVRRLMYPGTRTLCIRTVQSSADLNIGDEIKNKVLTPLGIKIGNRQMKGHVQYLAGDNQFRFPNGSMIQLGYCRLADDWEKHLGLQWDDIWIEQAEQHPERVYERLKGSNFPNNIAIDPRMYLTFNPGGIGAEWLERRIVNPATRDRRVHFVKSDIRKAYATLELFPSYILKNLMSITDPVLRAQWLDGDWDAQSGLMFRLMGEKHETGPTVREMEVPYWADWYGGADWGEDGPFAFLCAAMWQDSDRYGKLGKRHIHFVGECYERGLQPDLQAERVVAKLADLKRTYPRLHIIDTYADPSTGNPRPTMTTEQTWSTAMMWDAHGFPTRPSFRYAPLDGWNLIKYLIRKGTMTIDPSCHNFIKEIRNAVREPESERINKSICRADALDCARYILCNQFGVDYSEEPDEETRWEMARVG